MNGEVREIGATERDPAGLAEEMIGTTYVWGGRTTKGIDCSGLVQLVWAAAGIQLPRDTDWRQVTGVAAICGIGFTGARFIANVAFADPGLVNAAKLAILVASCVAAALGAAVLLVGRRTEA